MQSCLATQINYERNGSLYYKLLGSEYLKNYYLQGLGNPQEFDMNDAIEEVFDAAETSNEFEEERTKQNNDVLSSKSLVTIKETGKEYTIKFSKQAEKDKIKLKNAGLDKKS